MRVITGEPLRFSSTDEGVRSYHQRTKHRFEQTAAGPDGLDWNSQPDPFRRFDAAPTTPLPLAAETPPYAALYDDPPAARPLGIETLGALLELSLGLAAWKRYGDARWALRCNPSSGNLHPTEGYLILGSGAELDAGVYHYRSFDHCLEQRCRFSSQAADALDAVLPAGAFLFGFSAVAWREAWKYGERAYRYCQLDAGHALASLRFAAATQGWRVALQEQVGDAALAELLGLDRSDDFPADEAEHPDMLCLVLPDGHEAEPFVPEERLLETLRDSQWQGRANRLSEAHMHAWPAVDAVADATRKPGTAVRAPVALPDTELPASDNDEAAADVIRRRRSAQAFDGHTGLKQEGLARMLACLLPRRAAAPWDALPWPARIHPILFVHRVEDLSPGLYALPRRDDARTELASALSERFSWERAGGACDDLPLYHLVTGDGTGTAARLSCGQPIAGNSVFAVAMLAEFDAALAEGAWNYRHLHWEAGMLGHVLYLEAEALGLRGTGIGCFFDDPLHQLLGIEPDDTRFQVVYHFTVGGHVPDPRLQTLPAYHHLPRLGGAGT